MKKHISAFIVFALFLLVLPNALTGQPRVEQRLETAIIGLNQTSFSRDLLEQKEIIEADIASFFIKKESFSEDKVQLIQNRYSETKVEWDGLIDDLKHQFTDTKLQKKIASTPDSFTRAYQENLEQVIQNYRYNCRREIERLDPQGANPFMTILSLVAGVKEIFNVFKDSRKGFKKMSEEYFEKNYASKLRLKSWEDYK